MIKNFTLLFILALAFVFPNYSYGDCSFSGSKSIVGSLSECLDDSPLVGTEGDLALEGAGFKDQINKWINQISIYLGVLAVGAIVFSGLMMTLSTGEEEKVKKAKDIFKWALIGFLGVISASAIIKLIVTFVYSI